LRNALVGAHHLRRADRPRRHPMATAAVLHSSPIWRNPDPL